MTEPAWTIRSLGLSTILQSSNDVADVVFVHGLGGHPENSWKSSTGFFWPSQPICDDIDFRVLTFGYVADITVGNNSLLAIREYSTFLSASLLNHRQGDLAKRPLLFICHDVGGLVVKQLLVKALTRPSNSQHTALLKSIQALVFFATPHRGRLKALEKVLMSFITRMRNTLTGDLNRRPEAMTSGAAELLAINDDFAGIAGNWAILTFYEVPVPGTSAEPFIDRESALLHLENEEAICLPRTHPDLVRFEGAYDDVYRLVQESISRTFRAVVKPHLNPELLIPAYEPFLRRLRQISSARRVDKIADPNERTLNWIWAEEFELEKWRRNDRGLCGISGKPGSGKSTLMKKIYMDLKRKYLQSDTSVVGFFFSGLGEPLGRSFEGLLRLLLEHLLRQSPELFKVVLDHFPEVVEDSYHEESIFEIGVERLKRTVLDALSRSKSRMKLIVCVDALDECHDTPMRAILDFFRKCTSANNQIPVKACLSGRGLAPLLLDPESTNYGFVMEDHTKNDIYSFAEDEISAFATQDCEGVAWDSLTQRIVIRADGIFFWVELVCKKLADAYERGDNVAELMRTVKAIPPELGGVFETMFAAVDTTFANETNLMLAVVLAAPRPLCLEEFCFAIAFGGEIVYGSQQAMQSDPQVVHSTSVMMRRLRHRCVGLLDFVSTASTSGGLAQKLAVQLIHPSVKDFLLTRPDLNNNNGIMKGNDLILLGHKALTRACLRYLVTEEVQNYAFRKPDTDSAEDYLESIAVQFPFVLYAAEYGFRHYRWCDWQNLAEIEELARLEVNDEQGYKTWKDAVTALSQSLDEPETVADSLSSQDAFFAKAIESGFLGFVRHKFESGEPYLRTTDANLDFWLFLAVKSKRVEMVKLLLEQGADPNASTNGMFPLQRAVLDGQEEIMRLLLENNASPFASGRSGSVWEALSPLANLLMLQVSSSDLLEDIEDYDRFKSLWAEFCNLIKRMSSARNDPPSPHIVSMIFSFCPETTGSYHFQTMAELLSSCSVGLQRTILEENPTLVERRSQDGETALHFVSAWGTLDAVKVLIEQGADVHAEMYDGCNALFPAVFNDSHEILSYLLSHGVDSNHVSDAGQIAIHQAAMHGTKAQVEALVAARSDLSARDCRNTTVAHFVMLNPAISDIFTILKCSDMVEAVDDNGRTPLHWAAEHGTLATVEFALNEGAKVEARNKDGMSVLHFAARNCNAAAVEIMDLLFTKFEDINVADNFGQTPLHHVFRVLPHDGSYEARHLIVSYPTPLFNFDLMAAYRMIKCIIAKGADLNVQDECGNTPLHHACWRNSIEIVSQLLLAGANPAIRNHEGQMPIDLTSDEEVRKILLDVIRQADTPKLGDVLRGFANVTFRDGTDVTEVTLLQALSNTIVRLSSDLLRSFRGEIFETVTHAKAEGQTTRNMRYQHNLRSLIRTRSLATRKKLGRDPTLHLFRTMLLETFRDLIDE